MSTIKGCEQRPARHKYSTAGGGDDTAGRESIGHVGACQLRGFPQRACHDSRLPRKPQKLGQDRFPASRYSASSEWGQREYEGELIRAAWFYFILLSAHDEGVSPD